MAQHGCTLLESGAEIPLKSKGKTTSVLIIPVQMLCVLFFPTAAAQYKQAFITDSSTTCR